jgi:lipoxygenase homology domain-containing protein 1
LRSLERRSLCLCSCRYEFPVGKWLTLNEDGRVIKCAERQEDLVSQKRHRHTTTYQVIVYTGKAKSAGTDANVSMILYGTLGDTGVRPLKKKGRNLFESGQVDDFTIECLDLGKSVLVKNCSSTSIDF